MTTLQEPLKVGRADLAALKNGGHALLGSKHHYPSTVSLYVHGRAHPDKWACRAIQLSEADVDAMIASSRTVLKRDGIRLRRWSNCPPKKYGSLWQ